MTEITLDIVNRYMQELRNAIPIVYELGPLLLDEDDIKYYPVKTNNEACPKFRSRYPELSDYDNILMIYDNCRMTMRYVKM